MEHVIHTLLGSKNKIYHDNNHNCYLIKWRLISPLCKKWSRNRDADLTRVDEMIRYHKSGGYIPKILHLAEIIDEGLVCYDGNHRRELLNYIEKNENSEVECIIDVVYSVTHEDVYEIFENINKSVQLPAIYLNTENNKELLMNIVRKYETNYKPFLSPSPRCHAPQFNRDTFTDNLSEICDKLKSNSDFNINNLETYLDDLNTYYSQQKLCREHSNYRQSIIEKCKKHNLWLFIDKTIPYTHIEKLIKIKKDLQVKKKHE
jgi:hypothetical protein